MPVGISFAESTRGGYTHFVHYRSTVPAHYELTTASHAPVTHAFQLPFEMWYIQPRVTLIVVVLTKLCYRVLHD